MKTWLQDPAVAVVHERPAYARVPPYPPSDAFPEWPGPALRGEDNPAFRAVREALRQLGLDARRFGSAEWNPLRELVQPGETVVLKPNFVSHRNHADGRSSDTDCLVTHGSIVRAVVDYAAKALGGRGRVIVGDSPIQGTRWSELARLVGLEAILDDAARRFPGIQFRSRDYRLALAVTIGGQVVARSVKSNEEQFQELDLGTDSLLLPLMHGRFDFGVAQYPRHRMRRAHTRETNRYIIPRELLDADLFINLPKMKVHQKAGITCALKNLVGVNGHKDYLPHFRYGSPRSGGDEYPDGSPAVDLYWRLVHADWEVDRGARKLLLQAGATGYAQFLRRILRVPRSAFAQGGGNWFGNDTLWRTVLDINRAFLYFDRATGTIADEPRRRYLALLDGLVGGQGESPLAPAPVPAGLVLAARNPLAMDTVAAALMGLDWTKLPQLAQAYELRRRPLAGFPPEDVVIRGWPGLGGLEEIYEQGALMPFEPPVGWKGHVELDARSRPGARVTRAGRLDRRTRP